MKMPPSIFNDVIGPVMRGPSSSHCAASLRIGRVQLVWLCRGCLEDEAGLGAGRRSSVTWGNGRVQALDLNRITRRWW